MSRDWYFQHYRLRLQTCLHLWSKMSTKNVCLVQSGHHHHFIKCNSFSPWYNWKFLIWHYIAITTLFTQIKPSTISLSSIFCKQNENTQIKKNTGESLWYLTALTVVYEYFVYIYTVKCIETDKSIICDIYMSFVCPINNIPAIVFFFGILIYSWFWLIFGV